MTILGKGLVSLLTVAALSTVYAAQYEIMPTIGKKITNDDTTLDDSKVLYGVRGTAYVTPNIGIQAVLESSVNNRTVNSSGGVGDTDIERGTLNVVVEKGAGRVKPYALAGVGYEQTHGSSVSTTNDDSQLFYNAGIGVKFGLTNRIDLVTEVKGMHKVENDDDDIIGTVGVGVKLGEVAKPAPKCDTPQAMSLNEFAKMCKTEPQPVPAKVEAPVRQMQSEPQVAVEEQPTPVAVEEVVDEKVRCVVDVEAPETVTGASETAEIPEGFYVQMAALFKGNGEILTSKLERKKYPYVLYNAKRFGKDATLVLVGPYESRKEAAVALRYLKRLSGKAFIKRFP